MFEVDLARVIQIAITRVRMFDTSSEAYGSPESTALFREYRAIRERYERDPRGAALKLTSDYLWDTL